MAHIPILRQPPLHFIPLIAELLESLVMQQQCRLPHDPLQQWCNMGCDHKSHVTRSAQHSCGRYHGKQLHKWSQPGLLPALCGLGWTLVSTRGVLAALLESLQSLQSLQSLNSVELNDQIQHDVPSCLVLPLLVRALYTRQRQSDGIECHAGDTKRLSPRQRPPGRYVGILLVYSSL